MTMDENSRSKPELPDLRFEPNGELDAITSREQRSERLKDLADDERQLAEESARFADMCQYFSEKRMDIPIHILDELRSVSCLLVHERVSRLKALNQQLMEYLNCSANDSGFRF
jgi:hypothetical protein